MRAPVRDDLERSIARIVSEERRRAGLPAVIVEPLLVLAARAHSADMAGRAYFAHISPEGATAGHRVALTGYLFDMVGENIARGHRQPRQVMNAWMTSRGHRANILKAEFTRIGVGVAEDRRGTLIWTQNFAVPALSGV